VREPSSLRICSVIVFYVLYMYYYKFIWNFLLDIDGNNFSLELGIMYSSATLLNTYRFIISKQLN
jgi:hypothetical protein